MEPTSSAWPLPHLNYVPTTGYEPSHRHVPIVSHRHSDEVTEAARSDRNGRPRGENRDHSIGADALQSRRPSQGRPAKSTMASTSYVTHSQHTAWFEEQEQTSRSWRETSGRPRTPERCPDRECTHSPPSKGMRGQGSHKNDWSPPKPPRAGLA